MVIDTIPDRPALIAKDRRLTYRQLDERANRFAHYLEGQGIGPGAYVGILAHNCAEWAEAMVGCYKARTARSTSTTATWPPSWPTSSTTPTSRSSYSSGPWRHW